MKEYIYFDNEEDAIYSSSEEPLKYENNTLCVCLEFQNEKDKELILNSIFNYALTRDETEDEEG